MSNESRGTERTRGLMYFKLAMFVQRTQSERGRKTRSFLLELGGVYCILNLPLVSDELSGDGMYEG